ncbi:terpene cyclase [Streptomyces bambusae]|uniref:terpene synthase family protein n=1 Tax=Streptomyces bambusae TaxID=1550616 RepID=UPI001CFC9B60|nr:terpene cyclase [Streptomyces bambusae]MCB5168783.1 terpene cyclase [Streptomyces bambusae]
MDTRGHLHELDLPFPERVSPDADRARRRSLGWMRDRALLSERDLAAYDVLRLDQLAARAYPFATGASLDLMTDWMGWYFVFDDQFDSPLGRDPARVAEIAAATVEVMDGGPRSGPPDPLKDAFRELWERSVVGMSPGWRQRHRASWTRFIGGYAGEAADRDAPGPPAPARYMAVRRATIGTDSCFDLVERLTGLEVPAEVRRSARLTRMADLSSEVVALTNDLASLGKELASGEFHNIVPVLQSATGCTAEEAAAEAVRMVAVRVAEFRTLAAGIPELCHEYRLTDEDEEAVRTLVRCMEDWMRATRDWSLLTGRYSEAGVREAERPRPWARIYRALW